MRGAIGMLRGLAWFGGAAGVVQAVTSYAADEPVNSSGFVPGIVLGFMLVTGSVILWGVTEMIQRQETGWAFVRVAIFTLWVLGGPYSIVWLGPGWAHELPLGLLIALVAMFGLVTCLFVPAYVLVLNPLFLGIAWLSDHVPWLRHHGVGDAIRSGVHRRSGDP